MKLRRYMEEYGVTRKYLATKIGASLTTIGLIERGKIVTSIKTALAIEKLTDGMVTVKDMLPDPEREALEKLEA